MSKYLPFKELEREIVRALKGLGFAAQRLWDVQFKEKEKIDVRAEKGDLKLAIQCKYGERPNLHQAYLEAVEGRKSKEMAIGICRFKEERDTLVILSFGDFKKLLGGVKK